MKFTNLRLFKNNTLDEMGIEYLNSICCLLVIFNLSLALGKFRFEFSRKNFLTMGSDDKVFSHESPFIRFTHFCVSLVEKPVIWFREKVVLPNRQEYYWYHEKIRRVPTVDECYTDDPVCIYEANRQYELDRRVENFILRILRQRYTYCKLDNKLNIEVCDDILQNFKIASDNYFIKYGDLGTKHSALNCYMKQKNRMAWERRHGPVGSGKRPPQENYSESTEVPFS